MLLISWLTCSPAAQLRRISTELSEAVPHYVFAWQDGRPWTSGYVTHTFLKAAERAGVEDLHPHDCRHTFACRKLRAGVDLYTVSKLLRHASIAMTERYTHLSRGDLKAAVNRKPVSE